MFERMSVAPAIEPVTVAEQALFSHLDVPDAELAGSPPEPTNVDYIFLQSCVVAAREFVEQLTKIGMISQRWLLTFDTFPDKEDFYINVTQRLYYPWVVPIAPPHYRQEAIDLLRRPVQEAAGSLAHWTALTVTYLDLNADEQTMDADDYIVFADKIVLKPNRVWPTTAAMRDAVRIEYPVGYGDLASDVPQRLKQAVKFLAAHLFENRLPVLTTPSTEVLFTLTNILNPFKTYRMPR